MKSTYLVFLLGALPAFAGANGSGGIFELGSDNSEILIEENGVYSKKKIHVEISSDDKEKGASPANVRKFFIGSNGKAVDLNEYYVEKYSIEKRKYGNISPQLWSTLKEAADDATFNVEIEFQKEIPVFENGKKPNYEDLFQYVEKNYYEGVREIELLLERDVKELKPVEVKNSFLSKRSHSIKLKKSEIFKLHRNKKILHIGIRPVVPFESHKPSVSMASMYSINNRATSFELAFPELFTGAEAAIGVWEPRPADQTISYLSCGNLVQRNNNTPLLPAGDHAVLVAAIIRNCGLTDPNPLEWDRGGSPGLSMLKLSSIQDGDNDMTESFEWMISWQGRPMDVVNWSWMVPRELGGDYARLAWVYDRRIDIAAAEYPYTLTVGSAGNRGYTNSYARSPELQECMTNSANAGTGWTEQDCNRVDKWGYNNIIVGSGSTYRADFFQGWRNGPSGNEAPHLLSTGDQIEMPWNKPYHTWQHIPPASSVTGTSFASPAVASLAANMIGAYPGLSMYPEAVKAILMASATANLTYPVDDWPYYWIGPNRNSIGPGIRDIQGGVGTPKQRHIKSVVEGSCCGGSASMRGGYRTFTLQGSETQKILRFPFTAHQGNVVKFVLTWVSNPSNFTPGTYYPPDDLDLNVNNGSSYATSLSYSNTTELAIVDHQQEGEMEYVVTVNVYSRPSGNYPIFGAVAWREEIFTGIRN